MESIEAIREMNGKHPPGRRSRCMEDLCARVEELERENERLRDDERRREASKLLGGPLTPEELAGGYVLRGMPKPPDDREEAQGGPQETPGETGRPALDTQGIRRAAQEGLPITQWMILSLVERLERAEHNLAYAMPALQRVDTERLALLDALTRYINSDSCEYGAGPPCPGDGVIPECCYCQAVRALAKELDR